LQPVYGRSLLTCRHVDWGGHNNRRALHQSLILDAGGLSTHGVMRCRLLHPAIAADMLPESSANNPATAAPRIQPACRRRAA
jgi:hypothetical protein